jgi:hypothetical protein
MKIFDTISSFENPPAGVHPARLIRILDLGSQPSSFPGQTKLVRKIVLSFELLGEERMSDGRPFVVTRRFSMTIGEKSALRPFLEGWRGRKYSPEDLRNGLPIENTLGQYALLTLIESERDGRMYANIASASMLPKGMPKPEGVNAIQLLDLDDFNWAIFDALSDKLKETIKASPEYAKALALRQAQEDALAYPDVFDSELEAA